MDHRMKAKESGKVDNYLNLFRELKQSCNIKVTVIPIVVGLLGRISWSLEKGLEGLEICKRIKTILVEINQNTQKSLGHLVRFVVTQSPPVKTGEKNLLGV